MHYRLYRLNPSTGKIVSGSDLEADSDEAAAAIAREQLGSGGAPYELWRGTKCVLAQKGEPSSQD